MSPEMMASMTDSMSTSSSADTLELAPLALKTEEMSLAPSNMRKISPMLSFVLMVTLLSSIVKASLVSIPSMEISKESFS